MFVNNLEKLYFNQLRNIISFMLEKFPNYKNLISSLISH